MRSIGGIHPDAPNGGFRVATTGGKLLVHPWKVPAIRRGFVLLRRLATVTDLLFVAPQKKWALSNWFLNLVGLIPHFFTWRMTRKMWSWQNLNGSGRTYCFDPAADLRIAGECSTRWLIHSPPISSVKVKTIGIMRPFDTFFCEARGFSDSCLSGGFSDSHKILARILQLAKKLKDFA